jgi:hypothetical protein
MNLSGFEPVLVCYCYYFLIFAITFMQNIYNYMGPWVT